MSSVAREDFRGPHQSQPERSLGRPLLEAGAAAIFVHGRGDSADGILSLAGELRADKVAFLAPQAAGGAWYPNSFLAPLESNQPWLDSALRALEDIVQTALAAGIPADRVLLLGFSQGACLALEFAARNPRRFGALVGLSGGLIGPENTPRDYPGSLAGTPVFLGCSDIDPHIPVARVDETERVLVGLGARVEKRIYPGLGHTVNRDETAEVQRLLDALLEFGD
ncbi:MAG: alpha/beta hydrolase [Candidatus Dormibacteraeota bacterium]|nr:alpha/beta hydrolase [Candidatus Dormibacteraeota bacterium]